MDNAACIPIGDGNRWPDGGEPFSLITISLDISEDDTTIEGAVTDFGLTNSVSFVPDPISSFGNDVLMFLPSSASVHSTSGVQLFLTVDSALATSVPITTGMPTVLADVSTVCLGLIPTMCKMAFTARNDFVLLFFSDVGVLDSSAGTAAGITFKTAAAGSSVTVAW